MAYVTNERIEAYNIATRLPPSNTLGSLPSERDVPDLLIHPFCANHAQFWAWSVLRRSPYMYYGVAYPASIRVAAHLKAFYIQSATPFSPRALDSRAAFGRAFFNSSCVFWHPAQVGVSLAASCLCKISPDG